MMRFVIISREEREACKMAGVTNKKDICLWVRGILWFKSECFPVNYQTMCEHIVKAGFKLNGKTVTPEEVFKYSPTGELWKISEWYEEACFRIGKPGFPNNNLRNIK